MAKHVQGSAVANATSYKLYENISGNYTEKATQSSGGAIDFDLSTISFAAGTHQLAVKAFASGYLDSAYSNLVSYIVEATQPDTPDTPDTPTESTWYISMLDQLVADGQDLSTSTWMTTSTVYTPWAFSENINSKVQGKTINAVEVFANTNAGKVTYPQNFSVGVVNYNTGVYTKKATCVMPAGCENTRVILKFAPYTIGQDEFFTFNHDDEQGCIGYFLKDKVGSGVDGCDYMYQGADGGTKKKFDYKLALTINVGYIGTESGGGGNSGSDSSGTTWHINSLQQLQDSGNNIDANKVELQSGSSSYSWAFNQFNDKLVGKTINTIEMMPAKAGSFSVGIYDPSTKTVTTQKTFAVAEADVNTIKTYRFDDIAIPVGQYFVWNCSGNSSTSGEAIGYYVLKAKLDPLAVETSNWYQAKSSGLAAFGTHELVFVANIGYTA